MRRILSFILAVNALTYHLSAQTCSVVGTSAQHSEGSPSKAIKVELINKRPTGRPPRDFAWSPDDGLLAFTADGAVGSLPSAISGDIVGVEANSGKMRLLVSASQVASLTPDGGAAAVGDHRLSSFLWAPDSQHLLLDKEGKLWLWDITKSRASYIGDTARASGNDAKFSPDGRMVSYLRDHNLYVHTLAGESSEVVVTNTAAETAHPSLLNGEVDWVYGEEMNVQTNYSWSPLSTSIAYLQTDEAKVSRYPIEDFIPTHATVDWENYPQAGDANAAVRVGIVAASGGATKWVTLPFISGSDYIPRFGWVNEHTLYVEVLRRDQKRLDLYLADTSGTSHLIHSDTDSKYIYGNYDVSFLPHGRFLNTSWQDGHTHMYLYSFDQEHPLATRAHLIQQLTHGDYEVQKISLPQQHGEVNSVFFTSTEGTPLESHLWTMQLDGTGKRELTPEKGVHEPMVSPGGRYYTDQYSRLLMPPVVHLCSAGHGSEAAATCSTVWQSKPPFDA